jgi:pimeloyl-ACP methyl ester carboxylesterase
VASRRASQPASGSLRPQHDAVQLCRRPPVEEPSWFTEACAVEHTTGDVELAGCRVRYLEWEPPAPTAEPPLLLLHGTAAHAHWWSHIAPILARDRRVAALSFSGHGDSEHRSAYAAEVWADEVLAVADVVDAAGDGIYVVGHSLGAIVGAIASTRSPSPVLAMAQFEIIPDPARPYDADAVVPTGPRRFYATREEAVARFRPIPPQADNLPYVVDRVARLSVVEYRDGWSWKHDPGLIPGLKTALPKAADVLSSFTGPLAVINSERGLLRREEVAGLAAETGRPLQAIELPAPGHSPMLDQPLALAATIATLTSGWSATLGIRPR